jgi:NEDD8-activating enzyme E1 regulatory subunit
MSIQSALAGPSETAADASLYVLLRAVDRFYVSYSRYPGSHDSELEDDAPRLKNLCAAVIGEMGGAAGVAAQVVDDYVTEMCRFGAGELHVVAAVMGGVAAQEVIKLVTQQFVPIGGSFVFNAMGGRTRAFE